MERDLFTGHFYISLDISLFIFPSESPVREPSIFPNRVPIDRDTVTRATGLFIHLFMYVCWSPQNGAFLHRGENVRSPSTEPHADGKPTYNAVHPGSPRGSLMTLLSLPHCHAALSTIPSTLAWVDQSPVSQLVS